MGIVCIRSQRYDDISATPQLPIIPMSLENPNGSGFLPSSTERLDLSAFPHDASLSHEAISFQHPSVVNQGEDIHLRLPLDNDATSHTPVLGQMPRGKELKDLVELYFSSVHRESTFPVILLEGD